MINLVQNGLVGYVKNQNRFGIILDNIISKKLFILCGSKNTDPASYIINLIKIEYEKYKKTELRWDDNDQ